jgi:hypothetical protein
VDPSTATVLEDFAEHATWRLDEAAARLGVLNGDQPVHQPVPGADSADRWTRDEVNTALDPIIRARLARLERQLETLMTAVDDVARLGTALDTRR